MFNAVKQRLVFCCLVSFFGCLFAMPAFAVKTTPTIRIEIPQNNNSDGAPTEPGKLVPTIPLEEGDLPLEFNEGIQSPADGEVEPFDPTGHEEAAREPSTIFYGDKDLPLAVKATRLKLIEAANTGDIEKLRPILESFNEAPILSFGDEEDPVEYLKSTSGDKEGREILAILIEVLESGYVRRDEGEEGDIYIWPYFVDFPPESLKPDQIVELFQIITAGDFEDMQAYGTYVFYRVGIAPNGEMKFFLAGD